MSNEVFTFTVARLPGFAEGAMHSTATLKAQGGRRVRRANWPATGLYRVKQAGIQFPPNVPDTWRAFHEARQGSFDSFLWKPLLDTWAKVTDEALGTGDDSEDEFALDSKHIDASTLVVEIDDVVQGSGYALTGNNTAPIVDFVTPPTAGEVITATYERYVPCIFSRDDFDFVPRTYSSAGDTASVLGVRGLAWEQDRPGSHLV